MQTTIPTLGLICWGRRRIPAAVALGLLLVFGFAQSGLAQSDPPLNFGTNYFVTGDFVVAGAQGLNASFGSDGLGTGIISFPDGNPGIRGTTTVPKGANILAAVLYWQTVEKVGTTPGGPGSGKNGFFGPVFNGKPQLYPISGLNLPSQSATSFSNGGCSGTSTGKNVQAYRTDVRGLLPLDANGNVLVDKADGVTFEVRLPNVGNNTPLTLGASLVLIYRVISPNVPLNVITVYDGVFAPNTTPNFTMSQPIQGFYQAAAHPLSKLTHIVGAGKSNKFQQAYLNGGQGHNQRSAASNPLPSPYGNGQPVFPGWYVNWDNTTWVFPDTKFPNVGNVANPLQENDDTANTMVVASGANPGCVSWSATIVSTTVHDDNQDGILQIWKQNQGYTDVATGLHVDLTGASTSQQDVFLQLDHVVDANGDFGADAAAAANAVQAAFLAHGVHLHITDASQTTGIAGANAIPEPAATDGSAICNGGLCAYPNQTGITVWRDGVETIKDQPINYNKEADCEANSPPLAAINPATNCQRRFPPQLRNSHHYAVWGDTLGGPNWTFLAGRLTDSTPGGAGAGKVVQTGANTVTFYTTRGHGLAVDAHAGNGRVTITGAATNSNLNGTHLVTGVSCQTNPDTNTANDCSTNNRALGPYSFTISVAGNAGTNYTLQTDPYLSVASGQAGAGSGFSDVGGADTLVTLFQWGANATQSAKQGTLLHELGHTLGLLHGGVDNTNCKSNYQSVMNYMFQAKLLGPAGVLDLSSQQLSTLDETQLGKITTLDLSTPIAFSTTRWFDTKQTLAFKQAAITSFSISSNVVTFQGINNFSAGNMVQITGLTNGFYLNGQVLTVLKAGLSGTQFEANFVHGSVGSTADSGTARTTTPVPTGFAATAHCDGTPLTINDPVTYKYAGGTLPFLYELDIPWSTTSLDANFEGAAAGSEPKFLGYNDWANADYRQVGAGGNGFFSVPGGFVPFGPGGFVPFGPGGFVPFGPGGFVPFGPGGFIPYGPGGFVPFGPGVSGGGGKVELDFNTAVSAIDPPTHLTASEESSARTIDLNWDAIAFPVINQYNIYRSADQGATFSFLKSVSGPPAQDSVACNPGGYQYFVTAVFNNTATITSFSITSNVVTFQAANNFTAGTTVQVSGLSNGTYLNGQVLTVLSTGLSGTQFAASFTHANVGSTGDSGTATSTKESTASNTVSVGQSGDLLTACYVVSNFSSPANAVQGSSVQVTWTLTDKSNAAGNPVARQAANTLVVTGPLLNNCTTAGRTTLLADGKPTTSGVDAFTNVANQFTFTWNNTDVFCAGSYSFELDLDHVNGSPTQVQPDATQLQLGIDVTDTDSSNPHITTTAIPNGVVGTFYSSIISEHGGVTGGGNPFKWTLVNGSNPLPAGLSLGLALDGVSGLLSGIPSAAGMFSFTVQVTDSVGNIGTQTLTMTVTTPVAQINQPLVPDSSAPGAAALVLTLNGTGFGPGSQVLWNGGARVTTFISNTQLTAAISASDLLTLGTATVSVSNPVTIANKAVPNSNIDFFQITPATSASLSRTDYPTGTNPIGLIAADFNGDGKLDLAIANSADNTITILLGNGDGTFRAQPPLATGTGSSPQLPMAGDFNGDGKLDLAVANFANNTVSIFVGKGDGTFLAPATYAVGTGPTSLVTGDFNRDGKLDLAVANQNDHSVSILLGNGDATFQAHIDYAAGAPDVAGVGVGDFHRDGKLDLVVANPSANTVSVLVGNGDGTFKAPVAYATGNHPINVGVADLNADGILDLAVANLNDRTVSILLGNADGTFKAQVSYPTTVGAIIGPTAVTTGDFNGDGRVDLAITNQGNNTVAILIGNGDGTFHAPLESATGNFAAGVAAGDFNGDGRLDLAVSAFSDGTVSILRQRPEPATALAVSGATASQVSLTWTASASTTVVGYNVYRGATSGGPYTKVNSGIVAAPAFTDLTVAAGTTYYYVVTAVDPGNLESIKSNEVSVTTPPQAPTNLATSGVTASQVGLSWSASTTPSVTGYNVYRGGTSGGPYQKIGSVDAATSNFTDTTVASGTTYYYVVTAVGPGNKESVNSNEVSATTPPQPATNLSAAAQGGPPPAAESVVLNWSASSSNSTVGYNVYRSTVTGSGYVKLNSSLVSGLTYTDSTVQGATTYYYVVTAVGPGNVESVFSNEASATTP
jgi:fibronectin type 3 domain-containing protein